MTLLDCTVRNCPGALESRLVFLHVLLIIAATISTPVQAVADEDDFLGTWAGIGEGEVSATIRRGRSNPEYYVIELGTSTERCGGAVTVYGKASGSEIILAESYEAADPSAPVCRIEFELVGRRALRVTEVEGCSYYYGAACGFTSNLLRE